MFLILAVLLAIIAVQNHVNKAGWKYILGILNSTMYYTFEALIEVLNVVKT